ncbi:serine hydrolase [Daejeonella sp.]|uniref:serine hydrolase domain-containing protein n=1 Tax=Daejeonella sp. TaxID=2805397 RepID=UPI00272FAC0C|nr:serine hydrolase domain-containing protein [Daejeonella sp.]MDP2414110.1 serine hydrolase domain-containing protein [Daejeonella sp.]
MMRSLQRVTLFLTFAFFLSIGFAFAQKPNVAKIDTFFTRVAQRGIFQGSVLLSVNNMPIYQKAFGYANNEHKVKNTVSTKFRIASLSKTFTAIAIMQLVQEEKLNVTDRISDILDWYPKAIGNFVSIQDLMMMNSGIPSYTSNYDFVSFTSRNNAQFIREFILRFCAPTTLMFQPGSDQFNYSNSNYYILGAIIEQVTGRPYADVINEKIFKRIGMTNSGYYYNTGIYDNFATGYSVEPVIQVAAYYDQTSAFSTGGLYSTVEDLFKLDQALYSEKLLQKKYIDEIFKDRFPKDSTGNAWLYGWQYVPNTQKTMVYKTGILWGSRTLFLRDLVNQNAIILLNNTDNENSTGFALLANLLYLLKGSEPPLPVKQDICILMADIINTKGLDSAIAKYKEIKASASAANWVISDAELYSIGKFLLDRNDQAGANKIFKLIASDFPASIYATYQEK